MTDNDTTVKSIDVVINDLASVLADLKVADEKQKHEIFVRSLESLVRFAVSQHRLTEMHERKSSLKDRYHAL